MADDISSSELILDLSRLEKQLEDQSHVREHVLEAVELLRAASQKNILQPYDLEEREIFLSKIQSVERELEALEEGAMESQVKSKRRTFSFASVALASVSLSAFSVDIGAAIGSRVLFAFGGSFASILGLAAGMAAMVFLFKKIQHSKKYSTLNEVSEKLQMYLGGTQRTDR